MREALITVGITLAAFVALVWLVSVAGSFEPSWAERMHPPQTAPL